MLLCEKHVIKLYVETYRLGGSLVIGKLLADELVLPLLGLVARS